MTKYKSLLEEDKFAEPLERALGMIYRGMKTGTDNLDLHIDKRDAVRLGPLVEILNSGEIEYKQGNGKKLASLDKMLGDYRTGRKEGLRKVLGKTRELESLRGAYIDAQGWLTYLNFGRYGEATPPTDEEMFAEAVKYFAGIKDDNKIPETIYAAHFSDDPADSIPPSNTRAKYFHSTKKIGDLHNRLENEIHHTDEKKWQKIDVREGYRNDLLKLKEISADKYAYARKELLGMLDDYTN